jgi:hypothetical protein
MSELSFFEAPQATLSQPAAAAPQPCEECTGSGGWFRYQPGCEPAPGLLYLSCVQCRGSGRMALPRG